MCVSRGEHTCAGRIEARLQREAAVRYSQGCEQIADELARAQIEQLWDLFAAEHGS